MVSETEPSHGYQELNKATTAITMTSFDTSTRKYVVHTKNIASQHLHPALHDSYFVRIFRAIAPFEPTIQ
jgi:hypothetical protein